VLPKPGVSLSLNYARLMRFMIQHSDCVKTPCDVFNLTPRSILTLACRVSIVLNRESHNLICWGLPEWARLDSFQILVMHQKIAEIKNK
jgi:hypothetical protein